MKLYLDASYIQKPKHRRIFKQAIRFFADNENIGGQLILCVSPFAREKGFSAIHAAADMIAYYPFIALVSLSPKTANEVAMLRKRALVTLFHEMEHVRQFHSGELTYTKSGKQLIWMGEHQKKIEYVNRGFEIQADHVGAEYAEDFLSVFPTDLQKGDKSL